MSWSAWMKCIKLNYSILYTKERLWTPIIACSSVVIIVACTIFAMSKKAYVLNSYDFLDMSTKMVHATIYLRALICVHSRSMLYTNSLHGSGVYVYYNLAEPECTLAWQLVSSVILSAVSYSPDLHCRYTCQNILQLRSALAW